MGKHRPKHHRIRCRLTRLSFPINVLMLMTLMRHFETVTAIRAPLHTPQVARDARDNYQSNYEDGTAISTGYTLSQNYFDIAPSLTAAAAAATTTNDNAPTYGNAESSTSVRFEAMQRFPSTSFVPTTMAAAGQHFVDMEKGAEFSETPATRHTSISTLPQIGGIRATGRYTVPPGKIDYEINAANYDAGTEIASGSNEPGADIMQSNDAYDVATLHDLAHSQQAHRQQQPQQQQQQPHQYQQHRQPHRQPHQQLHQSQQPFDFDAPGTAGMPNESEEFENYKSDETETGTTPVEAKYQQLNTDEQNRQQQKHQRYQKQQQEQQQHQHQQDYLHNFETLQYANYRQKPYSSSDSFYRGILEKSKQGANTHSFMSLEPMQLSHGYRIIHNQQQRQQIQQPSFKNKFYQHRHSRDDDLHAQDAIKSQSQHYYTHTPVDNDLSAGYGRSLHISHEPHSISSIQSQLPPISHTVHHTPASSAASAGIPLSRHVEVVKHIPVPHHQRELVPYNHSTPIEIPSPVITTIRKPVPINIPVPKTVAVPQLQLVQIPIERIRPMPVERPVPYIVEKRVPYHVEKQVAKPVYIPYPLRVPVVNTVVHKLPRHSQPVHFHYQSLSPSQQSSAKNAFYTQVFSKSGHLG